MNTEGMQLFKNIKPVSGFKQRFSEMPLRDRIIMLVGLPFVILMTPTFILGMEFTNKSWFGESRSWKRRIFPFLVLIPLVFLFSLLLDWLDPNRLGTILLAVFFLIIAEGFFLPIIMGPLTPTEGDDTV